MKKSIFILALAAFACSSAYAQRAPISTQPVAAVTPTVDGPQMTFETTKINYGDIAQGSERKRYFKFKNTGSKPLTITNAAGSCGCTVPTWPKEPIMPESDGVVEVNYDTNRVGPFTKTVTLTTNAPGQESFVLTIEGVVKANPTPNETPAVSTPSGH